jgi:hypothetical protein
MRSIFLAGSLLLGTLFSCNESSEKEANPALKESLVRTAQWGKVQNGVIMAAMDDKLADPFTHQLAERYMPSMKKALAIGRELDERLALFQKVSWNEARRSELYKEIRLAEEKLIAVDSLVGENFSRIDLLSGTLIPKTAAGNAAPSEGISAGSKSLLLEQVSMNKEVVLNQILALLFKHTHQLFRDCSIDMPIIVQNSERLLPGELLVINAGVGKFNSRAYPRVRIGKKKAALGADGLAEGKLRAPLNPGNYSVPVEVTFDDQEGKEQTVTKMLHYKVISCKD